MRARRRLVLTFSAFLGVLLGCRGWGGGGVGVGGVGGWGGGGVGGGG